MAEGGVSFSSDLFKCSICLEDFKTPKLLPCFHTFCAHCLQDFIDKNSRGNKFYCPLCRVSIEKPRKGVKEFQTNFYIEAAKEFEHAPTLPCDVCGPECTAIQRCTDCEENICQKCTEYHAKMKALRQHTLIELSSLGSERKRKLTSKIFCADHPSYEFVFFCQKCEKRLCIVCKLSDHENHPTKDLASEAKLMRGKLTSLLNDQELKEKISRMKDTIDNRVKLENSMKASQSEEIREVKEHAKAIHRVVDELANEAEKRVNEIYQTGIQKIREEIETLQRNHKSASSTLDTIQLVLDHDNDGQIVENGKRLEQGLRDINIIEGAKCSNKLQKVFVRGKIKKETLTSMFAISTSSLMQIRKAKLKSQNLKFSLKFQVPLTYGFVSSIVPAGRDTAWVCAWFGTSVWLMNSKGQTIRAVDVGLNCTYAAANQNSEVIVSCPSDKCVKRVTASNTVEPIMSNMVLYPQGLAWQKSSDGSMNIIVSCTDNQRGFDDCSNGKTLLQAANGVKTEIASENRVPVNVAIDSASGKMCIVDYKNRGVTIHDASGKLLSRYSAPDFWPRDACFYQSDCILLVNGTRDIRAIQADGTGLEILIIKERCYSVAVCEEMLWIGLSNGEIEIYDIV